MKSCITCGMPFTGNHANDIGMELPEGPVCKFDVKDGQLKSPQEIFQGGVGFFAHSVADGDQEMAARLTRANMKSLPYWQAHPFADLDGDTATADEFGKAMMKLAEK